MIINIIGPNGAGKSTLVRQLIVPHTSQQTFFPSGKHEGYVVNRHIRVIGKYTTPCGGADGISSQATIRELVTVAAGQFKHVIFEGVIVSTCFGSYLKLLQSLGKPYCFAILLPPVDVCIERVKKRRAARGANLIFKEDNLRSKHAYVTRVLERCVAENIPHKVLSYKRPYPQLLELLK